MFEGVAAEPQASPNFSRKPVYLARLRACLGQVERRSAVHPGHAGGPSYDLSARLGAVDDIRLTEVEVRYTYLERLVEDLSKVLHDQQRLIDSLSTRVDRIESLIADAMNQSSERPPHEKPPHY